MTGPLHSPKTDAEYRAAVTRMLKDHTVCGSLVISPQRVSEIIATRSNDECVRELSNMAPRDRLPSIHSAIYAQAISEREKYEERYNAHEKELRPWLENKLPSWLYERLPDAIKSVRPSNRMEPPHLFESNLLGRYYRAADEVLGIKAYKAEAGEKAPDHGLICQPKNAASVVNVEYCSVEAPRTPQAPREVNPRERR